MLTNSYQAFTGTISNIGVLLDSTIRTAKVRVEVRNPGMMRPGMFATAMFTGLKKQTHTLVPSTAILRIHDRDWVYVPAPDNRFRRVEVVSGDIIAGNNQEIISGITPGQKVVSNALALERTISQ